MKLSKAQQAILDEAKTRINIARAYNDFAEYYATTASASYLRENPERIRQEIAENPKYWEWYINCWNLNKDGIVHITANSKTIKNLEAAGVIEVIKYGGRFPDTIKVIDY